MATSLVVETRYGKVQGLQEENVQVWKGIPYAAPPVGNLRFRPPQPLEAWDGVRDATKFGPITAQIPGALERLLGRSKVPSGEDSLYLNIWSPAADDKRRPVMVWVHGGAFLNGSGSTPWYDGTSFAANGDVVIVTINYRLNIFGFLHLAEFGGEEYATSGNCGLLDQIAALQWVRDNIAAFGGDPERVTLFGESAGAMSVASLLGMPAAQGLFQQAILESGAAHNVRSAKAATKVAGQILEILGLKDHSNPIAALQELPTEQLLEASKTLLQKSESTSLRFFQPVVDGISLPELPGQAVAKGSARNVTLLIGTNAEEMKLYTVLDPSWATLDEAGVKQRVANQVGAEAFASVSSYYADQSAPSFLDKWTQILTDRIFWLPALRLAEAQLQTGGAVWMYRFDWRSTAFGGQLGAAHAIELPFVWNNLDALGASFLTGEGADRQGVADQMHAAWIAFAHNANPGTPVLPDWPAYTVQERSTLIFNNTSHLENDVRGVARRVWENLI